jgi:hypothetical protein
MSSRQLLKTVQFSVVVTLISASTLAFVQTELGRLIFARYFSTLANSPKVRVAGSDAKNAIDTNSPSSIAKSAPPASEPSTKEKNADSTNAPTGTTTSPGSTGGTVGSATTTGTAPSEVLVRDYMGQAADVRLKFVLDDLRVDLRKASQEIAEAKGRAPAVAIRTASDVIVRSQDRTETLLDIARDIDYSRSQRGNTSPAVRAAGLNPEPITTGAVLAPKEAVSWLEPGTVVSLFSLVVALLVFWFGDNLSGRWARRRDPAPSAPSPISRLPGPSDTVQPERQPALTAVSVE